MKNTILLLSLILLSSCNRAKTEIKTDKIDLQPKSIEESTENEVMDTGFQTYPWFSNDYEGVYLLETGIPNPMEYVAESLRKRTDLIPLKAVLGGTMEFERIELLSHNWVIADYSDGHIEGKAIYSFSLNKEGKIEYTLIKSTVPK